MSLPSAANYTIKVTLSDANTIVRCLQGERGRLLDEIDKAGGPGNLPGTAAEVGRIETILRRDFGVTP